MFSNLVNLAENMAMENTPGLDIMSGDQHRASSRSQSRTSHFCKFVPKHSPATVKIFVIWQKAGTAKNDVTAIVCYSTALFPQVLHLQYQVRLLDNITCGPDYFTNWPLQGWVGCSVTLYYLTVTSTFTRLLGSEVFTQGWMDGVTWYNLQPSPSPSHL